MIQLKKLFIISTVLIFGLSSCSKDDPAPVYIPAAIEGKWQFTKEGEIIGSQEVLEDYQHTSGCTKDYTEILAGNIIKDHYFDNPNCRETIDNGTWNRNNNSLVLSYPDQPNTVGEILELTNTTLKVKVVLPDATNVVVLTRIQ